MKRTLFILAGLAALAVTLIRAIAGTTADLGPLLTDLADSDFRGVVFIMWHAITVAFALLAVSLFLSAWLPRPAAILAGLLGFGVFGATCMLFMIASAAHTGSPFTWFPWIPLGVTSLLSLFAAISAIKGRAY